MSFFTIILVVFCLQIGLEIILIQFIANKYLIELIIDIIIAFVFAIMMLPGDRKHFYKYEMFHKMFTGLLSLYLVFAMLIGWVTR